MTRRDFVLIAEVVANIDNADVRRSVALDFATELASTNGRFDRLRFLRACDAE